MNAKGGLCMNAKELYEGVLYDGTVDEDTFYTTVRKACQEGNKDFIKEIAGVLDPDTWGASLWGLIDGEMRYDRDVLMAYRYLGCDTPSHPYFSDQEIDEEFDEEIRKRYENDRDFMMELSKKGMFDYVIENVISQDLLESEDQNDKDWIVALVYEAMNLGTGEKYFDGYFYADYDTTYGGSSALDSARNYSKDPHGYNHPKLAPYLDLLTEEEIKKKWSDAYPNVHFSEEIGVALAKLSLIEESKGPTDAIYSELKEQVRAYNLSRYVRLFPKEITDKSLNDFFSALMQRENSLREDDKRLDTLLHIEEVMNRIAALEEQVYYKKRQVEDKYGPEKGEDHRE